jgi:hypothetical protein
VAAAHRALGPSDELDVVDRRIGAGVAPAFARDGGRCSPLVVRVAASATLSGRAAVSC